MRHTYHDTLNEAMASLASHKRAGGKGYYLGVIGTQFTIRIW